jgi:hypothetical protein
MSGVRGAIVGVCAAVLLGLCAAGSAAGAADGWATGPVRIEGFEVEPVARLEAGVQIPFTVYGSPGATATLRVDGARAPLALREIYGGVYEGRYVVRPDDRIAPHASATATLRRGGEMATARLEDPLVEGVARAAPPAPVPAVPGRPVPAAPTPEPSLVVTAPVPDASIPSASESGTRAAGPEARASCADCAVIESVDAIEPARRGVGGSLADRLAEAHERHMAFLAGAFGGHPTPTRSASVAQYEVRFRLPDGRTQVRRFTGQPPPWRAGDVVPLDALGARSRGAVGPTEAGTEP